LTIRHNGPRIYIVPAGIGLTPHRLEWGVHQRLLRATGWHSGKRE